MKIKEIAENTTTWLKESGDEKGKLPARYKRYTALACVIFTSWTSLTLLHQGLVSNTAASFHGRLIKAELSEYPHMLQLTALSTYLFAALSFDFFALKLSLNDPTNLVAGTLAIDSFTKQMALKAKLWMKPKGKEAPVESTAEESQYRIIKWLRQNGDDNPKTPARYQRYGALIAAQTATVAGGYFMGQGIVTMTVSLFHGRLIKAETKEWGAFPKISAFALYLVGSAALDAAILTLMKQPLNLHTDGVATSIALSISLKTLAELSQKWLNPVQKGAKKAVVEDLEAQTERPKRRWACLIESSGNKPAPLTRALSIAATSLTTVLSIRFLKQGLISKTCGMFQGRLLKAETNGWTKKGQYGFLTSFLLASILVDILALGKSYKEPRAFIVATLALNLLLKIVAIDAQKTMNPNFVDDEDEDEAPQKEKKVKKPKKTAELTPITTDQNQSEQEKLGEKLHSIEGVVDDPSIVGKVSECGST